MTRRPRTTSGSKLEQLRLWSAELLSGIVSLAGCGSETPTAHTDTDADGTRLDLAALSNENNGGTTNVDHASNLLLESAPDQWLRTKIELAAKCREEKRYSDEVQVWEDITDGLSSRAGANYWVTAGARLSHEVSLKLAKMNRTELEKWDQFQTLEARIQKNRSDWALAHAKGELSEEQYVAKLASLVEDCNQQTTIVETLFGESSHLLGNVLYQRAELQADQGKFVSALMDAERSLKIRELSIQVQHPDTLKSLKLMGRLAQKAGRLDLANDCLSRALRQAEFVWGRSHLGYADHANDLGVFYYWAKQNNAQIPNSYSDAGYWLTTARDIRRGELGEENLLTAMSERNIALLKMSQGVAEKNSDYLSEADAAFERAIPVFRSKSTDKVMLIQALIESASAKMLVKEFSSAESRLKEARNSELAEFRPELLPNSVAELELRTAIACLSQDDTKKKEEGESILNHILATEFSDPRCEKAVVNAGKALASIKNRTRIVPAISDLPSTDELPKLASPDSTNKIR